MDHWSRIEAAIAGKLAALTLEWQRAWDFDLVKFMPSGTCSVEDWGAKID